MVIPAFNEERTMAEVIRRVRAAVCPARSSWSTMAALTAPETCSTRWPVPPICAWFTCGRTKARGRRVKLGFQLARGSVVLVQDADLEYDPAEYEELIRPIVGGQADVVFGSRFPNGRRLSDGLWHFVGNRLLTLLSNMATNLHLSDMETGYKVFRGDLIRQVAPTLRECRFGIEPEITAKIARIRGVRICERPIHYSARGYAQGKKIGWRDGVRAVWCILRYAWG